MGAKHYREPPAPLTVIMIILRFNLFMPVFLLLLNSIVCMHVPLWRLKGVFHLPGIERYLDFELGRGGSTKV